MDSRRNKRMCRREEAYSRQPNSWGQQPREPGNGRACLMDADNAGIPQKQAADRALKAVEPE